MTRHPYTRRDVLTLNASAASNAESVHIASLVVQAVPAQERAAREHASRFVNAEVHGSEHPGKFVVVLESADDRVLARCIAELHAIPGVLTISVVSHLIEDADRLDEVIDDASESAGVSEA